MVVGLFFYGYDRLLFSLDRSLIHRLLSSLFEWSPWLVIKQMVFLIMVQVPSVLISFQVIKCHTCIKPDFIWLMIWFVLARKYGLDDNTIDFIGHAVALHRDDRYLNEPALDTVKRMKVGKLVLAVASMHQTVVRMKFRCLFNDLGSYLLPSFLNPWKFHSFFCSYINTLFLYAT